MAVGAVELAAVCAGLPRARALDGLVDLVVRGVLQLELVEARRDRVVEVAVGREEACVKGAAERVADRGGGDARERRLNRVVAAARAARDAVDGIAEVALLAALAADALRVDVGARRALAGGLRARLGGPEALRRAREARAREVARGVPVAVGEVVREARVRDGVEVAEVALVALLALARVAVHRVVTALVADAVELFADAVAGDGVLLGVRVAVARRAALVLDVLDVRGDPLVVRRLLDVETLVPGLANLAFVVAAVARVVGAPAADAHVAARRRVVVALARLALAAVLSVSDVVPEVGLAELAEGALRVVQTVADTADLVAHGVARAADGRRVVSVAAARDAVLCGNHRADLGREIGQRERVARVLGAHAVEAVLARVAVRAHRVALARLVVAVKVLHAVTALRHALVVAGRLVAVARACRARGAALAVTLRVPETVLALLAVVALDVVRSIAVADAAVRVADGLASEQAGVALRDAVAVARARLAVVLGVDRAVLEVAVEAGLAVLAVGALRVALARLRAAVAVLHAVAAERRALVVKRRLVAVALAVGARGAVRAVALRVPVALLALLAVRALDVVRVRARALARVGLAQVVAVKQLVDRVLVARALGAGVQAARGGGRDVRRRRVAGAAVAGHAGLAVVALHVARRGAGAHTGGEVATLRADALLELVVAVAHARRAGARQRKHELEEGGVVRSDRRAADRAARLNFGGAVLGEAGAVAVGEAVGVAAVLVERVLVAGVDVHVERLVADAAVRAGRAVAAGLARRVVAVAVVLGARARLEVAELGVAVADAVALDLDLLHAVVAVLREERRREHGHLAEDHADVTEARVAQQLVVVAHDAHDVIRDTAERLARGRVGTARQRRRARAVREVVPRCRALAARPHFEARVRRLGGVERARRVVDVKLTLDGEGERAEVEDDVEDAEVAAEVELEAAVRRVVLGEHAVDDVLGLRVLRVGGVVGAANRRPGVGRRARRALDAVRDVVRELRAPCTLR
eukprot:Opistho-1_new@23095